MGTPTRRHASRGVLTLVQGRTLHQGAMLLALPPSEQPLASPSQKSSISQLGTGHEGLGKDGNTEAPCSLCPWKLLHVTFLARLRNSEAFEGERLRQGWRVSCAYEEQHQGEMFLPSTEVAFDHFLIRQANSSKAPPPPV